MENPKTFGFQIFVRSNMRFKKEGAYANAVAKDDGLFAENGSALLIMQLTKAEQDEFNGKKKAKKKSKTESAPKEKGMLGKLKDKIKG